MIFFYLLLGIIQIVQPRRSKENYSKSCKMAEDNDLDNFFRQCNITNPYFKSLTRK